MSTATASYIDAIAHLPAGGTLLLYHVSWTDYEQLLTDLSDGYGVRVSYDEGRLEIMSPLAEHEAYKDLIHDMVRLLAIETGGQLETRGSATLKQQLRAKGAEPDACFYVQNAARIIGKRRIDLTVDPPPDIVVEIDVTNESLSKFPIYAALGVPEIWRYDEHLLRMYLLEADRYTETPASHALPALTSALLTDHLEQSKSEGQSAALQRFRDWVRGHQSQKS